jgi:hypothetical protein
MCHRSVGLVQGAIEGSGIPSVTVSVRPDVTFGVRVPRAAFARFPHGNPLGEQHQPAQHHLVLAALLQLLETAEEPTFVELPFRWRRWGKWL